MPAPAPRPLEHRPTDLPVGPRLEAVLALAFRARRAVLLEGPTGIGKSELVQQVARRLGVATAVLDLSLLEPPDLVGLPVIADGRTSYAVPHALPTSGEGILMLEELNRAERYIQQPALQLLTARRLHEYVLPDGWVCFAAINPEAGDYQVTPLDRALRARFLTLSVRADRASWVAWAVGHGIHPGVVALAQAHDRVLDEVPPRSWTYVSQLLHALSADDLANETLLRDAIGGYLPPSWTELLLATRANWVAPSIGLEVGAVLAGYGPGCEAQRVVRELAANGQTDRLDELSHRVAAIVAGPEVTVLAGEKRFALESFEALLADLPGDQRERLQDALAKNPTATPLIDIKPDELLANYARSAAEHKVRAWLADPLRRHRVALLVASLRAYLEQRAPKDPELRRSNVARINLGLFLAQLGERWAMPLVQTLLRLGITPIRPGVP